MRKRRGSWDDAREDELRERWAAKEKVKAIAEAMSTSRGAIYKKIRELGLPTRPWGKRAGGKPTGKPDGARTTLESYHPAAMEARTIHWRTVVPAAKAKNMLKSGVNSSKIGAVATKGHWKGFPLFTLTLEERATCPRSCAEWLTCYGNNLGHTSIERIKDDPYLELRLHSAIAHLAALHPAGFAVRLHVLGDFFSVRYVQFWREMMMEFPALHIFGFTARQPTDEDGIGLEVWQIMHQFDGRAMIRFSGGGKPLMCSEVVDRIEDANFIVCPAERIVDHDCARCGLCWTSAHSITFLRH